MRPRRGVLIKDKGSSNGTFLNGTRISEATAADGDVVTFGKVAFHVKEVTAPHPGKGGRAVQPPAHRRALRWCAR